MGNQMVHTCRPLTLFGAALALRSLFYFGNRDSFVVIGNDLFRYNRQPTDKQTDVEFVVDLIS